MNRIDFGLPPTSKDTPPAFVTPIGCHDWLASVPRANSSQAQGMLLRQLQLLLRFEMPAAARFELLEALRESITDVQGDAAKKFAGKPLPFAPQEQAVLDASMALWQALLNGYLSCLQQADNDSVLDAATVAQRSLAVFSEWQVDLCRGELLPDAAFWRRLHQTFAAAETLGVAQQAVNDVARHGNTPSSPLAAYGEVLLVFMASPYELPPRHLNWIARWAKRWGSKLALTAAPQETAAPATDTPDKPSAQPLFVDLASDRPVAYQGRPAEVPRWLDTSELRRSLKSRIALLEKGEQPSRLQLGDDCTQPAAGQLLQRVYQRWCKGGAVRRHTRAPATGGCEFIVSLDAVHYYLAGRTPFRPPTRDESMLRKEREEMATFGGRATHHDDEYSAEQGYQIENWMIIADWLLLDQSASGLRLSRPLQAGVRVGTGQLIAIKLAGSAHFVTGSVRWALHEDIHSSDPQLSIGVQMFPGVATPIAARGTDSHQRENFRQALLLPAIAALKEPESIIVPMSSFRIDRPMELYQDGKTRQIVLTKLLDRGSEFERCTFKLSQ